MTMTAPLRTPDEEQVLARVVGVDLRRDLVEPLVQLLLGEEHPLEVVAHVRRVHRSCSS